MTTQLEERIARVARARGVSFNEAARLVTLAAWRRRRVKAREAQALTRLRKTWSWARDFE